MIAMTIFIGSIPIIPPVGEKGIKPRASCPPSGQVFGFHKELERISPPQKADGLAPHKAAPTLLTN
jgi:hypothetical protein